MFSIRYDSILNARKTASLGVLALALSANMAHARQQEQAAPSVTTPAVTMPSGTAPALPVAETPSSASVADPVAPALPAPQTPPAAPATDAPTANTSVPNTPAPDTSTPHHHHGVEEEPDIIVSSRRTKSKADPLQGINVASYKVVQAVDDNVVGPLARGYEKAVPLPIRDGLHNALYNLHEPFIAANFLLQLKPVKAVRTVARFALNTTVGLAGLFDVARRKPFKMPRRTNSFANTLGYYGIGPGPYMYLPLLGPTTARDLVGRVADRMLLPVMLGSAKVPTEAMVPMIVVGVLDRRLVNDERIEMLKNGKPDPYTATREDYLQRRKAEIEALHKKKHKGEPEPAAPKEPTME